MTRFAQMNELRSQPARSLLQRLFRDVRTLVGQEYHLVRTELLQKRTVLMRAAWSSGLSVTFGVLALVCLTAAGVSALSLSLGLPLAAAIFGVVYALVAIVFAMTLRRSVAAGGDFAFASAARLFPKDHGTTKTAAEQEADIEWTRRRIDETVSGLERKSDLAQPLRDVGDAVGERRQLVQRQVG